MKTSVNVMLITLALSGNAMAAIDDKQEQNSLIGFGSGVLVGTVVAGPIGGVVAGVMGLLIAEDVNNDEKLAVSEGKLTAANKQLQTQQASLLAMQQDYQKLQQQSQLQLVSMDKQIERVMPNLESSVQFRSGSWQLESHYRSQLDLVAEGLNKNPDMQVTLNGYADRHGDETFNHGLSEQRILAVKKYLLSQGVKQQQIASKAHGETQPVSEGNNYQDDFFDRRVMLHLHPLQAVMTAKQP